MALTARTPTGAVTAGTIPESWSQLVLDAAEKELVAWDATDHSWQTDLARGDKVNIPIFNHVASTEVVVGTKASSLDIATGSKKQLTMDQWFEAPIDVDYMTLRQTQIDWGKQARQAAAYSIRLKVDSTVTALYSLLNNSSVQGTDGGKVTDQLLIDIKELLDESDVPMDADRFIIGDPSLIADMLTYDKFVAAQYVAIGPVANGQIGTGHPIYGASIRVTNNLAAATTGNYAVMIHRKAIASALQIDTPWMKEFEELHQRRYQHEALWGNLQVRDDFGIPFYTRKS